MTVFRFKDVRSFEAAMAQRTELNRFTLTPVLASEWFGLSARAMAEMIDAGGLDAVITDDGHTFVDANELAARELSATENPAALGWFRAACVR